MVLSLVHGRLLCILDCVAGDDFVGRDLVVEGRL
jgi:hypothetical protein